MARRLIECVPNFSEGRDRARVDAIASAIRAVPGSVILDIELDQDHNRSVITFVAPPESVVEAALACVSKAVELIDLNAHKGVHPRIGAADVVPFIPIEGVTMDECVELSERAGGEIWKRLRVPVYLYEESARRPERVNLENIRRGQFEGLRDEVRTNPDRLPDFGNPELHATAGAIAVGARKFLVAYNINLGTPNLEIAKDIARAIRHSSGGYRFVKAMGVMLQSRNMAQVSMNLTDFEQTPLHRVFEAVCREAEHYGVPVVGSEIIGLIPKKALEMAADHFLRIENFQPSMVLENRVADALADRSGLSEFLDALAAPSAAPGGGSAAAAAGAMAAALGSMVCRLAKLDAASFENDRAFFTSAVQRDADAYNSVVASYRVAKEDAGRAAAIRNALQLATSVPLEVAERAHALSDRLASLGAESPDRFASDMETARDLAAAARGGALANVRINLDTIRDEDFRQSVETRLTAIS